MTVRPLDHDFALRSALSRRGPREVDHDEHLLELTEELDRRLHIYPALVAKGSLRQEDGDQHIAVWRTLIDDHHRAAGWDARIYGRAPVAVGPWRFDWPTRIRELRRELALRRAAYPKWIASATNPLTAGDAARKLERLDAIHYRYWADLFCFSPPGVPRDADPARAAWAAHCERRRMADTWRQAIAHAAIAPRIGDSGPFDWGRARERIWRVMELAARQCAGLDLPADYAGLAPPNHTTWEILRAEARRRADEALDQVDAGTLPQAVLGQLEQLARWRWPYHQAAPAAIEERKAA